MAFCTSCGKELPANSQYCPSCGANFRHEMHSAQKQAAPQPVQEQVGPQPMQQPQGNYQMDVPNHLVKAVIITLCCCLPMGVVSIIFAAQVDTKLKRGDYNGALESSKKANLFANLGIVFGILYGIFMFFVGIMGETGMY